MLWISAAYDGLQTIGHRHPMRIESRFTWLISTTFPNDTPGFLCIAIRDVMTFKRAVFACLCTGFKAEETSICQKGTGVGSVHDVPRSCRVPGHDLVHNTAPQNAL
ncbi:hypothetical protein COCC4DRAFT_30973 [Bipolaris maydis ATCC 48331]|uniref:Uncharacterized protein n=2 Tax=Cochliobolus heterostrophus TaxID=5016 RepID=M2T956_COCH5|nr:uncharacterized protein COCC4DRAFT_30973 [Bipolaris maydis ATCC 48331]EMD94090.1 hypothetical protein COCHEDRAFT_1020197 [Bipolaris maydis C5]ENI07608.1 hypothetical protein COCC4DRAFT_30973 [Bipolaris maydis ATCC 48331]